MPIFSPTVTTMRFQPIMVPRPSASATATFTQTGMNLVSLSMWLFSAAADFCSAGSVEFLLLVQLFRALPKSGTDRCAECCAGPGQFRQRLVLPVRSSEISRHLVPIAAKVRSFHFARRFQIGRQLVGGDLISGHGDAGRMPVHLEGDGLRGPRPAPRSDAWLVLMIHGVSGRQDADQDQHDQSHALLAVVRAVPEADAGAGQHQQAANPQRRRFVLFRGLVQFLALDQRPS